MVLVVVSSDRICFIKAAFQGIGTQQGFFVNNLPFLAKLSNHLATIFRKRIQAIECIERSKWCVYLQRTLLHRSRGASAFKRKWYFFLLEVQNKNTRKKLLRCPRRSQCDQIAYESNMECLIVFLRELCNFMFFLLLISTQSKFQKCPLQILSEPSAYRRHSAFDE